ncbi:MAG: hypothetical protein BHW62_05735 [Acinetobacter sp. CAG:196_36_41]|nr:MAG: hypothetical protein BHW62_05735 [Acinetobacter sp. CAG:196_36_41]
MKENNNPNSTKGIIYITETIVDGLIKIGKTQTNNFEQRMYQLEHNGYCNVTGLRRRFAIEVDKYHDKELLIHEVFGKSQVGGTELFALNIDTVIQLLSSFEGKIIYPKEDKNKIFEEATEKIKSKSIQNGTYFCSIGDYNAKVEISDNGWTLLKNSIINTEPNSKLRGKLLPVLNLVKFNEKGIIMEDFPLGDVTPSFAGNLVCGNNCNGWFIWKDENGKAIDCYRSKENDEE